MSKNLNMDPMLEMFVFETLQLIDQLEQAILVSEKSGKLEKASINEIFRIMHTIKGSAALMLFSNISEVAHSMEDVFFYIRENNPKNINYSDLTDLVLKSIDFFKNEVMKIENGKVPDGEGRMLNENTAAFLMVLKSENVLTGDNSNVAEQKKDMDTSGINGKYYISSYSVPKNTESIVYKAVVFFEDGCEMENVRAYSIIHNLKDMVCDIQYSPGDIINNEGSTEIIRKEGFKIVFRADHSMEEIKSLLEETIFLKELRLEVAAEDEILHVNPKKKEIDLGDLNGGSPEKTINKMTENDKSSSASKQNFISVSVTKMDILMDLVGELVISEAMVTQNPDLKGLQLDNFNKSARQLKKITDELQDIVMSIRMVPLSTTFQKMNRIVRDMSKKLNKEVKLEIIGEETEVDKNIIEHISDPLMHLIRNSIDHGIETLESRISGGKPETGKITLEAKNSGGDVWIIIRDDGKGLDREKIFKKACDNGLVSKPREELTDREIFSFILLPGFSTKDTVSEFSGRGVGMDVVVKSIENIGGSVLIDSIEGQGTTVSIKIPLTLAIIDGMVVKVGNSFYTIPTVSIKESFKVSKKNIIRDTENNEMVMVRGECFSILRLHSLYDIKTTVTDIPEGIIVMAEGEGKTICLFADALLGENQVVVKSLPKYINKKIKGIAGCTLLGEGSISLILDVAGLVN